MLCNSKENSIKFLAARGATNDVRKVIDQVKFDELNDQITKLAETKYGLKTMGAKLFSIAYEQTRYLKDTPIYRESTYTVPRAIPNEPLFKQLDVLITERENRGNIEGPMFARTQVIEQPKAIASNIFELNPNITEQELKTIYDNYVELMNKQREGKAIPFNVFQNVLRSLQVYNYNDTYIFGTYDLEKAVFVTRLNSSPSSKELLAEAIPNLVNKGVDVISFVPEDYATKLKRSGYTISKSSFNYDFKGEEMQKFAAVSNPTIFQKIFGKSENSVTAKEIEDYNKNLNLKYTSVSIADNLIVKAGTDLSKILETYLNQFGIVVKDINTITDKLNIDTLGFADILSKIAYVKDKQDLPPIAGEFIAYMMQYNPLVSDIIKELSKTKDYQNLEKEEYFKIIGDLIADDLKNKLKGNYSKSLIDKIKQLLIEFFNKIKNVPVDLINKNIGIISNNILQQNKNLVTSSLYKPGAYGKTTKQVSLLEALNADKFGATIINKLSKEGFILTGSTSLGEQGTIQRPDENLLHDIDWVSPFDRETTKEKFLNNYPNAIFVRDIIGKGFVTDTWLIAPTGYAISNYKTNTYNNKIIIESYDVINSSGKVVGTYKLEKNAEDESLLEVTTGIEGKVIDFFTYEKYDRLPTKTVEGIKLSNWKDIFKAKLEFARYKDIWDYNRYIPNENLNNNEFDLPIFEFDITNLTNARAKEIANVLAERLTLGLKVNYANITQDEAREILKNSPIPYQGEPAFFFAGSVYIVDDNVTVNTVLHEFSHPLIEGINKTNSALFNNLYMQLAATIEGKKLEEYVKRNYPELAEGTDRFKREVLTYGLQLAAQNKVANQIASKGFDNFIKNLLFQIKQLLKKIFGNKVNVAKLNESTTLEELADMLLEKDFVFDTEKVTYDDAVAFARNQIERVNILTDNVSTKAITDAINALYMTNLGILNRAKNFKTNKKTREILVRSLIKEGTTELTPGIKDSLQGFQTVIKGRNQSLDTTLENALNAEELRLKDLRNRAVALVSSLELTNNSVKLIRKEINLLAQKKNFGSRSDIALIGLYKGSLTRWFQSVSDIYNILTEDFNITTDNDFSQLLNEISTNVSETQKTIANLYKEHATSFFVEITGYMSDFVKDELKTELGNILKSTMTENEFEDLYNSIIQQKLTEGQIDNLATQKGVPVQYLNRLIDRYNYFVINETKINDILEGKFKDVSILNRFMESYSSSTSPIVGSLSIFIENQKNQAEQKAWEKSSKFRAKLAKLLPAIAEFSKWNTRDMLDLMSSKDSIAFFDKEQNKMVQREVYTFLNEFGNGWRYDLDMLEYKVDEARKNGDVAALKAAELELRQFHRDYMHNEYVSEFYEKDDIFDRSPIAKQAWLERKLALDEFASEANKLHNEAERFEAYSTIQEAWRKYQLLYSLYNEDGTAKTGEELEKTKILLEHRSLTRDFYEFIPIPGSLQTAYNEFVNLKRAEGVSEEDLKVLVAQWEKQNTRLQYKPEFYEERTRLLNRLAELRDKQQLPQGEFDVAAAIKTIYDLIYGFKDEQGQPDPNALGEDRLAEIKDLQQQINNYRFDSDNKSGLSRTEVEELRGYVNAQRIRNLTAPEQSRYLYLIQKQSGQGLSIEESVEMQSIISELAELTFKIPTEYYLDELNYNLSKFNIEAVTDENVDEYINSEDFIELVKSDKNFFDWFLLNHVTKKVYDKTKKKYVNKFERTLANTVTIPRDTNMIETTKIIDTDGNEVTILGVPNSRHSIYTVKDKYRTIPFGLTADQKKQYIGKVIDNKGNFLPRMYDGTKTGARTNKYMNQKFFDLKKRGGKAFELLEAIKEYHLSNQEGTSNMAKLYMDVPRYAIDTVLEAFQSGQYGDRYKQLKDNASEFWAQMFGKSKVDFENGFNYNAENNLINTDLNGEEISYIPVTGLYNLESDKVSPDIFQGLMRYALSLEIHDVLLENLPLVQSLIDTLSSPEAQPKNLNAYRKDIYNAFGALQNVTKKGTTNQMLGQLKSLFEREFYGVQQSQNAENYPRLSKALNAMQKASSMASLAVNIPSDLKNKYGAMVQLIIEASGAEFIGLKDLAAGRAWAFKAMMNWSSQKGIYAIGPAALTTQLVEIFNPVFRSKENTGRSVTRSLFKDLINGEWMYMHRKFGEMEVGLSLFGSFINAQKVEQTINGQTQTIRYIDAWETNAEGIVVLKQGVHPKWNNRHVNHTVLKGDTISSIAKQYGITTEELKAKNRITSDVELIEGEEIVIAKSEGFDLFRNQVQGTSRYLFGAYDDFGQPEGNKYTVYRLYMFMRKWFTTMFTNRFGAELIFTEGKMLPKFNARYDWALGKTRKGYYITAFEVFINMLKSRGENLKYRTNEEKIALRKVAAESLFITGFALMAALLFGYDDDDEDKWKKIAERSEALGTDGYKTYGFLQNHMLALLMGTQAETTAFIPLPKIGGVQFGLDDYGKMLSQTSTSFGNTILLYSQIFQDFLNMITFSGAARYKKDSGPYPWEQEGKLKIVNDLMKAFGFTGSTGDPETIIKNIRSSGERIGR